MNNNIQTDIAHWNLRHLLKLFREINEREKIFLRYRMGIENRSYTKEELDTNIMSFVKIHSIEETAKRFNMSTQRAEIFESNLIKKLSGYVNFKNKSLKLKALLED